MTFSDISDEYYNFLMKSNSKSVAELAEKYELLLPVVISVQIIDKLWKLDNNPPMQSSEEIGHLVWNPYWIEHMKFSITYAELLAETCFQLLLMATSVQIFDRAVSIKYINYKFIR